MEGDAGADQLNPTETDSSEAPSNAEPLSDPAAGTSTAVAAKRSRLGRGSVACVSAALVVLAAGMATAGYLALHSQDDSAALAHADQAAVAAAKDCIAATHAPDTAAMLASQEKILACSTGEFGVQATLYSGVLVDAYQAADVQVRISDMRAAVERHNDDGSINVLVAVRVRVTNAQIQDQEQGYRLRVRMAPEDGQYKISRLDQVSS